MRRNVDDGNLVDKATRRMWESGWSEPTGGDGGGPADRPGAGDAAPTDRPDGVPTVPAGGAREGGRYGVPTTRGADRDTRKTEVYRPGQAHVPAAGAAPAGGPADAVPDPMADPPVGWLVVVAGPGKGHVVTLGNGVNTIGRDRTERVSLDYGDKMISRAGHGSVTYDPRGRKFYVQHGGGTNLTYVDDEPVLAPRELAPLAHVQMGATVLRFVPLCGSGFSWEDKPDDR